jgi:3-oxoacyl-ACP reductase-like protein
VAVGLGAVSAAASAPAPVDAGRPSGAATSANSQSSRRRNTGRSILLDDRIEIVSPGHLHDHLTVEYIRAGDSSIRNPILVSHVAKGILPFGRKVGINWGPDPLERPICFWRRVR